jgi:hypothetical protein
LNSGGGACNPDPFCVHIDRYTALAAQRFRGLFGTEQNGTPQERLAAQIEKVRRDRVDLYGTGVFLVFEAREDIESPDFTIRRDLVDVAICFDAISTKELRAKFAPAVHGVLTAMALGIAEIGKHADTCVQKVGDICYLVESGTGKPIAAFQFRLARPT